MSLSQFKHLPKYTQLLRKSDLGKIKCFQSSNLFRKFSTLDKFYTSRYCFASKKKNLQNASNNIKELGKNVEDLQFLWKLSTVINLLGIGGGFYLPKQSLLLILNSNAIFQVYGSSKKIDKIVQLSEKSVNLTEEQFDQIKTNLKKVLIANGFILASATLTSLGVIYPWFANYSLIGLNFWILFNIKFNQFSQGFYAVLLSLLIFQYFYFTKVFQSAKQNSVIPFE